MSQNPDTRPIYLDYNATTPVDPRVAQAMLPVLEGAFGNPSSSHVFGQEARRAIDQARLQVADLLGARPDEIIFTSGGTESNNHAILGAAKLGGSGRKHIVTSAVEHPAVTEVCRHLKELGFSTTQVGVDENGRVNPGEMIAALTDHTALVSLMLANNEVGTLQPVAEVAAAARARGILVHTDCAQAVGKVPVKAHDLGVDLLSLAGHKLYAPKGVGVLFVRRGLKLPNLMHGAGHEDGRRPGTENILEIVGLGRACALIAADLDPEMTRLERLRDRLETDLLAAFPSARVHGQEAARLPNTLSIGFAGAQAGDIMAAMPEVAVSAGAACHGSGATISHVLQAMKVDPAHAFGTLRISLGRMTTEEEVRRGVEALIQAVQSVTE